jgi:predicted RNA-binding protein with PIN domain
MCPCRGYGKIERMPYWFDGNNLIGQSVADAGRDRATRRAFLEHLSRFSSLRGGRFVVFFDGDDPDRAAPPGRLQVRYSAPLSTDDAILKRLDEGRTPSEVIVVTNDRSFASRCRERGAKSIDWKEFNSRMRTNPVGAADPAKQEEDNTTLDEWIRYFGIDDKTLRK